MINVTIVQLLYIHGFMRVVEIHRYVATDNTTQRDIIALALGQLHAAATIALGWLV